LKKLRPPAEQRGSFLSNLSPQFRNDAYSLERIEQEGGVDASDYSTVFIAWGPKWNAEKVFNFD
jgi:hypothetical protein